MRRIVITGPTTNTLAMTFDQDRVKDSEALHHLLCEDNPGENYTVEFSNIED